MYRERSTGREEEGDTDRAKSLYCPVCSQGSKVFCKKEL